MDKITFVLKGRRAIITVEGPMDADQTIAFISRNYRAGTFDDTLWDLRRCSMIHLQPEELRRIADAVRAASGRRQEGHTVFIATEDADFGMLRMYTAYAEMEGVPATYHVCRTMEEAVAWLQDKDKAGPA